MVRIILPLSTANLKGKVNIMVWKERIRRSRPLLLCPVKMLVRRWVRHMPLHGAINCLECIARAGEWQERCFCRELGNPGRRASGLEEEGVLFRHVKLDGPVRQRGGSV